MDEDNEPNADAKPEDSSPQDKGETVPIGRFNEVYKETKELKEEVAALKGKAEPEVKTPESQKEAQAEEYLGKLVEKELTKREEAKAEATVKEEKDFEESIKNTLSIHTDVDRNEFLKFYEDNIDKYGFQTVDNAMTIYRDMNNLTKETEEKTKEDMAEKPSFPKNEGASGDTSVFDDSGKTLQQIANEAVSQKKD